VPNGKYEPQCGNCISYVTEGRSERRYCRLHDFVMPAFHDYVVCSDWHSVWNESGKNPFGGSLKTGVLYRWDEYTNPLPREIGRFDQVQELLMDRSVTIVENPERGWAIYIPQYDHEFYPSPGETATITLDDTAAEFAVADVEIVVTYTYREADRHLRMEDRAEIQRAAFPVGNARDRLVDWMERHHGLAAARTNHARNLANPRVLNKNKPLRLLEYVTGKPALRLYSLRAGLGVPDLSW
jgi:hypothetical protein